MSRPNDDGGRFRSDIQGLRALAVLLVLCGHAGLSFVPGGFVGVDVFFVISGFLITGLLVGELRRTGRISFVAFYVRRAKRLLPAASVVLVATLALTYLVLPATRFASTGWDFVASGLFAMNWRLAGQSADYLRADEAPSILQHFWSLAVEEQFYLIWPPLLLAAFCIGWRRRFRHEAPRRRTSPRPVRLLVALAIAGIPSLIWSVTLSQSDPGQAYFVTTTRMWELAIGGGLAIAGHHLSRLPRVLAVLIGWAGVAAIVLAAVAIEPATATYPGYLALLPTLGTAAVIVAGSRLVRGGPGALLGTRPLQAVGAISYSLYLWHWPLLIAAQVQWGTLEPRVGLAVVAGAVVPAALTYRFVENPVRRAALPPVRALRMGAVATTIPAIAGIALLLGVSAPIVRPPSADPVGAAALGPPGSGPEESGGPTPDSDAGLPVDHVDTITPDPLIAGNDIPTVYRDGCITEAGESLLRPCVYGVADSTVEVALAGDSHAAHWVPALQSLAIEHHWRLVTYIKTSCPFVKAPAQVLGKPDDSCTQWNANVRAVVTGAARPDLLVVSSLSPIPLENGQPAPGGVPVAAAALAATWAELAATGLPLAVIRDTPLFSVDVPECVSQHREQLSQCAEPRDKALAGGLPQDQAAVGLSGVHLINLNDAICPAPMCAAIIGGTLIYRDKHHLTATYVRTLAPRLYKELRPVLPEASR